tara:strand:+ start:420 stop:1691 length:1272 start_codon:yes stop_codon:yes gene_type:complete
MSVRKNQNQVEELRAQIEACAVVARQQAQSIDARASKADQIYNIDDYEKWIDRGVEFYKWLKKNDVPKNKNCGVPKSPTDYDFVDCSVDGYRMTRVFDPSNPEDNLLYKASLDGWTHIPFGKNRAEKLNLLQRIPGAEKVFCFECDTCTFVPFFERQFIKTIFFMKAIPQTEINTNKRKRSGSKYANGIPANVDGSQVILRPYTIPDIERKRANIKDGDNYVYTLELISHAEWVYIAPDDGKGFVFCNVVDTPEKAKQLHVAWNQRVGSYIYIELICSKTSGLGPTMLQKVYQLAASLNINRIVLSSLGYVIFFYLNNGFHLANSKFGKVDLHKSGFKNGPTNPADPFSTFAHFIPIPETDKEYLLDKYKKEEEQGDTKRQKTDTVQDRIQDVRLVLAGLDPQPVVNDEELTSQHALTEQLGL